MIASLVLVSVVLTGLKKTSVLTTLCLPNLITVGLTEPIYIESISDFNSTDLEILSWIDQTQHRLAAWSMQHLKHIFYTAFPFAFPYRFAKCFLYSFANSVDKNAIWQENGSKAIGQCFFKIQFKSCI